MSDRPSKHAELLLLCGKVRDNALTPEEAGRLDALLQDSDQAKALYVRYMSVLSLMESRGASQTANEAEPSDRTEHDVFSELLALEQQAEAELAEQPTVLHLRVADERTAWQFGGALRWLASQPAAWGAIAALFAVALVLVVIFTNGPKPTSVAVDPTPPVSEPAQKVVATLTDEHNALWAEGASAPGSSPRPGDALAAGQRLNLTAGFAEITTQRGAVVIVEAPATIELLDHDNALRLQAGKMVGICETASSKGLLVRTPHLDVIDLGTEFGIEVTDEHVATTVFTGLIEVTPGDGEPQRLVTNQTARLVLSAGNRDLVIDNQLADGFDALREQQAMLAMKVQGTGVDAALDERDPNWRITAISGNALESPLPLRVADAGVDKERDPLSPAKMLKYYPTDGDDNTVYQMETILRLPDRFDDDLQQLFMRFRADNTLLSLFANGQAVQVPKQSDVGYGQDYRMLIDAALQPGTNHLVFEIRNRGENTPENPVGIQVVWELQPAAKKQTQ